MSLTEAVDIVLDSLRSSDPLVRLDTAIYILESCALAPDSSDAQDS
jgi:hypothetical protein